MINHQPSKWPKSHIIPLVICNIVSKQQLERIKASTDYFQIRGKNKSSWSQLEVKSNVEPHL